MRIMFVSVILLILTSYSYAQETADGRWLDDDTWQPRNQHATIDESPNKSGDWPIVSGWGPDTRLTFTHEDGCFLYHPRITTSDGVLFNNLFWDAACGMKLHMVQSLDSGENWTQIFDFLPPDARNCANISYSVFENYIYYVFHAGLYGDGIHLRRSTDGGLTWQPVQVIDAYPYGGSWGPSIAAYDSIAYAVFARGGTGLYGRYSSDYGQTWSDNIFISDSAYVGTHGRMARCGYGSQQFLHLARAYRINYITEVHYKRSTDWGLTWEEDVRISHFDSSASFWPRIAAWDSSSVVIAWCDYRYSPYAWTGDIIIRRSFDNGVTWYDEQQVTFDHFALDCDIEARGDSIYLAYTNDAFGNREIMFIYSSDAGETWSDPYRVTNARYVSDNPDIFVAPDGRILLTWADARDDTITGGYMREIYFNQLDQYTGIETPPRLPRKSIVLVYPNPFNLSTTITFKDLEGGDVKIGIYDVQGRLIKILLAAGIQGGDKKAVWDARDNSGRRISSGIYFVRVESGKYSSTIKLLYLR